ncbi:hypothetical protein CIT31_28715 [Mesorhizobium wenxiniae]|uniref:Integrase catalytic domain-containing protein n=1 Tax=Mesorhizobium wenxiniae TaxID=2014805 RepID=A0A271K8B4_9HYPH|nr:hypothetical protein CIT31_28715 [Mesorhizobium wenxiniae]
MTIPQDTNQRWRLDFASDLWLIGALWHSVLIDELTRECLATVADNSISGEPVTRELDAIAERRGCPLMADERERDTREFQNNLIKFYTTDIPLHVQSEAG